MKNTLLSHLEEDQIICNENVENSFTVEELIERGTKNYTKDGWYVATKGSWKPNAKRMVEDYLENESHDMYEDFEENVNEVLKHIVPKIQKLLDKELENNKVCDVYYFDYTKPIEIDM